MKKLLLAAFALSAFVLISCSNDSTSGNSGTNSDNPPAPTNDTRATIDLRNKDSSGVSVSRTARTAEEDAPIGKFLKLDSNANYTGPLTDEDLQSMISFEDNEKGIKVNYKTPASLNEYALYVYFRYMDNNGNWSTRQDFDLFSMHDVVGEDAHVKQAYSWVYPFVLPEKTYTFGIHFQYVKAKYIQGEVKTTEEGPNFLIYYQITPKHGIGIIDDLPKDWNTPDYTVFKDGVLTLENVIPPESEYKLQKTISLYGTNSKDKYWTDFKWIGGGDEDITDKPDSATTMDLRNQNIHTDYPYVYCEFLYKYYLEGFDYCYFQTPSFMSKIIENTDFKN